jgi:hypothetical protein
MYKDYIMEILTITLTALISFVINCSTQSADDYLTVCHAPMNWHN